MSQDLMSDKSGPSIRSNNIHEKIDLGLLTARKKQLSSIPFVLLGVLLSALAAVGLNYIQTSSTLLILGGAVGLVLLVVMFQNPEVGGYLLIFTVFTNLSDLFTEKGLPSINKPLVAVTLLTIFANYILRTGKLTPAPKFTRIELVLLGYLFVVFASSYVAIDQSLSLQFLLDLAKDIAVGYCIYATLNTKTKWKNGIFVLIFAVTFVAVLGVVHTFAGTSQTFWGFAQLSAFGQTDSSGTLRYAGPLGESNIWGQVLVSIIPFALYRVAKTHSFTGKTIFLFCAGAIILAMLFTESRGAFLAFVSVLVLMAIEMKLNGPTITAITIVGLAALFLLPSKYTDRIKSLDIFFKADQEYGLTQDESVAGRRAKMLTGLAMFEAHPFLGVGFANYSNNYWSYAGNLGFESSASNTNTTTDTGARQPHSLYIEIMAETGLLGILTFIGFFGLIFQSLFRLRKKYQPRGQIPDSDWSAWITSIAMSLITFLIAGFFLHGIGFRFIWVLAGLALAVIHISKNEIQTKNTLQPVR